VLLSENVRDEEQIIPTLIVANEIGRSVRYWIDAKERIVRDSLSRPPLHGRIGNLHVVKVVDGTLILKREPVFAELVNSSWNADVSGPLTFRWQDRAWLIDRGDQPPYREGVLIRVYPYKRRIEPREITSYYEEVLGAEGKRCGNPRNAIMEYEFTGACLYLLVASGVKYTRSFPPSSLVSSFYEGLAQQFKARLMGRQAGGEMDAKNLIPACVAFFLRASGGMKGRVEIERLLNEHVLCEIGKYLPEGTSAGPNVKLWDKDVKKAQKQIMRMVAVM
jgi:hypothetical protein